MLLLMPVQVVLMLLVWMLLCCMLVQVLMVLLLLLLLCLAVAAALLASPAPAPRQPARHLLLQPLPPLLQQRQGCRSGPALPAAVLRCCLPALR